MRADAPVKSWLGLCATTEARRQSPVSIVRIAPSHMCQAESFPGLPHPLDRRATLTMLKLTLPAMRVPLPIGMGAIQFSLGQGTTEEEIQTVVEDTEKILTW